MAFKYFKTYGRHRNRVVKTDLWISPAKNRLFSSSDSANTTDTDQSCQTDVDNSISATSILLRNVPSSNASETNDSTTDSSKERSCNRQNSACRSLFVEHSTPLSSIARNIATHHELKEISPLVKSDFSVNQQGDYNSTQIRREPDSSPNLFSDTSNCKDSNSSMLEGKDDSVTGTRYKYESKAEDSNQCHHLLVQSGDKLATTNESDCDEIDNSPLNVDCISDKMKDLRLLDVRVYLDCREGFRLCQLSKPNKQPNNSHVDKRSDSLEEVQLTKYSQIEDILEHGKGYQVGSIVGPVTPISSHLDDQNLKMATQNNLSFVEALTPLRFQQRQTLSPKEKVLAQCGQQRPLKFTEVLAPNILAKCVKVGEGTYGEVYKTNDGADDVAIKVIPIEGNFTVNDEEQKSFHQIMPEIVISKELSDLESIKDIEDAEYACPNFIKVKRVMLVQDSYPQKLLDEWDEWKTRHKCENERPDIFPANQYFILFEFLDGGEDLERFEFHQMEEARSVLQQIVLSLSVSEQSLQFEHRDLHWGNVLIKRSKCQTLHYKLNGKDVHLETAGVLVSIIDFTLSRLTKDGVTVYCDLSEDPDIFTGKGDYQFEVYRLMRKAIKNTWEDHVPYSNVLWVRYLVDKILNAKQYPVKSKTIQRNMRSFFRRVLSYNSALETLNDDFLELNIPEVCN